MFMNNGLACFVKNVARQTAEFLGFFFVPLIEVSHERLRNLEMFWFLNGFLNCL